jgi:hypothetical protein
MEQQKIISGDTEEKLWQQVAADLKQAPELLQYDVLLDQQGKQAVLSIDIDPGGGFESGYATTQFLVPVSNTEFELTLRQQGLLQEAGKLFGLQDIIIGIPEIDKKFIIQSNDEAKAKTLFSNNDVNELLLSLDDVTLQTTSKENTEGIKTSFLEMFIEDGITDPEKLRVMYTVCVQVRDLIDGPALA